MPILKLEPNKPYTIALKYPTAKQVDGQYGPQLRWILSNGDLLYTPMVVGPQIEDLAIRPGQPFTITKITSGRSFNWIAEKCGNGLNKNGAPGPRSIPQRAATPGPHETHKTPIASILEAAEPLDGIPTSIPLTRLEDALKTAVAAAAAAERYAESISYACRFSSADVKSMAISVLIGMQKGNRAA